MPRYFFTVDKDLKLTSLDKDLQALKGKSLSEVKGLSYDELLPKIYFNNADAILQALRNGNKMELDRYRFDCFYAGSHADIVIEPVKDKAGQIYGAKVAMDLRAVCPLVESLQQSQRLIDIGKIATTLAHGVRNPLNAIKGAASYLGTKYAEDPTVSEFTTIIEEEITRLDNFIVTFLSTSISDSELCETDLVGILKKMEAFISLNAQSVRISTSFEYGEIPPVMANPFLLEQAIQNVLNSAMQEVEASGGGDLSVKARTEQRLGIDFVLVAVSNTGPGISKGNVDGSSYQAGEKGKGFGLFLTREIIQYHGGHLEVKREKGVGTTVSLYLPVNRP
jgi:two-component system, NtrC family, nitrogen regulation sensor histidine kinase GlnL